MVFVGEIDSDIVAVTGYCPDSDMMEVYWLNWHHTHKDRVAPTINIKI